MSDFILVILTAEGCGRCHHSRGDGLLGNQKQFLQYNYLKKLLSPIKSNSSITLLNIHFLSMNGSQNQIKDISKFTYNSDGKIQEEMYFNKDGYANVFVKSVNSSDKVSNHGQKEVKMNENRIEWKSFVDKKISKKIENYTFFYPCFIIFRKEDWLKNGEFLGITSAGNTVLNTDGTYGLEKNAQSLSQRNVDPDKLVLSAITGDLEFKPHKSFMKRGENKEGEKENKEGEKENKEGEKENKEENKFGFIIKNYEDED